MNNVNEVVDQIKKGNIFNNVFAQVHYNKSKDVFMHQSIFSGRWSELEENEVRMLVAEAIGSGNCNIR